MSNLISTIQADPRAQGAVVATTTDGVNLTALISSDGLTVHDHTCVGAGPSTSPLINPTGIGTCPHMGELRDRLVELLDHLEEFALAETMRDTDPKRVPQRGRSVARGGLPWIFDGGKWRKAENTLEVLIPTIRHTTPEAEALVPAKKPTVPYPDLTQFLDEHCFGSPDPAGVIIMGSSGDGKDYLTEQWAAERGLAYTSVTMDEDSTSAKVLGSTGLDGGATVAQPGPAAWLEHPCVLVVKEASVAREAAIFEVIELLEVGARTVTVWREGVGQVQITRHPFSLVVFTTNTLTAKHAISNRSQGAALRRRAPVFVMRPDADWTRQVARVQLAQYLRADSGTDWNFHDRKHLLGAMEGDMERFAKLADALANDHDVAELMDFPAEIVWRSTVTAHTTSVRRALQQHWVDKPQEPHHQQQVLEAIKQTELFPEAEAITLRGVA